MASKGGRDVFTAIKPETPVLSTFAAVSPISPSRYQTSEQASSSFPRVVVTRRLKSRSMSYSLLCCFNEVSAIFVQ